MKNYEFWSNEKLINRLNYLVFTEAEYEQLDMPRSAIEMEKESDIIGDILLIRFDRGVDVADAVNIINLTPHAINIISEEGTKTIEPSGKLARVQTELHYTGSRHGIEFFCSIFGDIEGLPEEKDNHIFIVSGMVLSAIIGATTRDDVFAPADLVMDNEGKIIGCKGLRWS